MKRRLSLDDMRNTSDDPFIDVDTKKAKRTKNRNKDKTTVSASRPSELIDDVINSVVCDSDESPDVHKSCSSTQTESSDFIGDDASLLQLMQCELIQLKEAVGTLTSKIDQLSKSLLSNFQVKTTSTVPTYASVSSVPTNSAPPATSDQTKPVQHLHTTSSSVDPVAAMYIDLSIRKQRANNIVITGMPPAQSPDHEIKAVIDLLTVEFGWDTDLCPRVSVARCRRLGKPRDGKLQPLLVTFDSRDQAEFYIKNACLLRQSSQPGIRTNVFINPDLTPAEGKAAFELRERRRMRRQDSTGTTHDTSAIHGRTFYQSSTASKTREKSIDSQSVTINQNSVPLILAAPTANLACSDAESPSQLKFSPPRLVYRTAVTAKAPNDGHLVEQLQQHIQPVPSASIQQGTATNGQFVVTAEIHAPFNNSGRPANSRM
jgi:hypothetical protein